MAWKHRQTVENPPFPKRKDVSYEDHEIVKSNRNRFCPVLFGRGPQSDKHPGGRINSCGGRPHTCDRRFFSFRLSEPNERSPKSLRGRLCRGRVPGWRVRKRI